MDVGAVGLVLLPALLPVLVGLGAPQLAPGAARYLAPAVATRLLTAVAITVALTTGLLLCLACYLGIVQLIPLAHPVDWSLQTLRHELPIPTPAALAAGLVATGLLMPRLPATHADRAQRPPDRGRGCRSAGGR